MKKTFGIRMPSDLMTEIERLAEQRGESATATAIHLMRFAIASERLDDRIARLEQRLEHRLIGLEQSQGRHSTGLQNLNSRLESMGVDIYQALSEVSNGLFRHTVEMNGLSANVATYFQTQLASLLSDVRGRQDEIRDILRQTFNR